MERPLLKAILERVILFFVPIALGYLWRAVTEARAARRAETKTYSAPQPRALLPAPPPGGMSARSLLWLAAAGAALVAVSLVGGVLWPRAPQQGFYVPAIVEPGGSVSPGHFETPRNSAP